MKEDMTRQAGFLAALNLFLTELFEGLEDLATLPDTTDLCDIVTPGNVADLADLLNALADAIENEFLPTPIAVGANLGFLAQIERLVCIIRLLATRVSQIVCPTDERGLAILREILCVLVEALAILVGIIIKLIVLVSFLAEDDDFFECLVCSLIKEITALEGSVKDLSCLIIALLSNDIDNNCTPCFVATNSAKRPRINVTTKNVCGCKKS